MGLFGQARDMYKLQKQAKQVKKDLANLHIEAEVEGIMVTISGEQEVVDLKIPEEMMTTENHMKLQRNLMMAFNKANKKSQEVAAEKMRDIMGDLGLNMPGAGGDSPAV